MLFLTLRFEPLVIRDEVIHGLPQQFVRASACASRQIVQLGSGIGCQMQFHNNQLRFFPVVRVVDKPISRKCDWAFAARSLSG
jgi:hypothetical protein